MEERKVGGLQRPARHQGETPKKSFLGGFLAPEQEAEFEACYPEKNWVTNRNSDAESK